MTEKTRRAERWALNAAFLAAMLWVGGPPAQAQDKPQRRGDDQERGGKRLIRKTITDRDEGIMARILRLMGDSTTRLELHFDPGEKTQKLQQKIIKELDEAIQAAAARTRKVGRRPKPTEGEKRKMMDPKRRPDQAAGKPKRQQVDESGEAAPRGGEIRTEDAREDSRYDVRRGWGALPDRQRDEVIQGFSEQFLESYRIWIERYYRALQESHE
ncbi:MAG: hypothetical protein ACE5E5_02340 [Phycisphaerae bacterium]